MAEYIKIKHIILISTIILLVFALLSSIAVGNSREDNCQELRRELKLCDFLAPSQIHKKICVEHVRSRYGTVKTKRCRK